MAFNVIKGTLHIVGYSPDGDSIRFRAYEPDHWQRLYGKAVRLNNKQHAQLRIESIDTLETHYSGEHQPKLFADAATERLFCELGIHNVRWNESRSKVLAALDGVDAFIVTRRTDRYGRPIVFLYPEHAGLQDGQDLFVNKTNIKQSINYAMLAAGMAYPTFYDGLFYDLRDAFAQAAQRAREQEKGLWAVDKTNNYIAINTLADLTDSHVILPKLFRRMLAHIKDVGEFDATAFIRQMKEKEERVFILNRLHFTYLHNLLEVNKLGKIRFKEKPEEIIFIA